MKSLTQKKIINCDTNEEYDSDDNVDDSEEMRKKEEQEKKKKKEEKKVYQFFKNNSEMALIYKRINDLRRLELKYFKRKGKENEIWMKYITILKKSILKNQKLKVSIQ